MGSQFIRFIFFSNYFVGFLAIALAIETVFQLGLPFNTLPFYLLLFLATVLYYTRAYTGYSDTYNNPRGAWYAHNTSFIKINQRVGLLLFSITAAYLFIAHFRSAINIPVIYWIILASIPVAGLLYYGMAPGKLRLPNLRNTGWLKPFVIGYVWAAVVGVLPVAMLIVEEKITSVHYGLMFWLFIKNWMFCTVNAIMFDIKDYADDSNRQLKTFVVRVGLRQTIFSILIPLLLLGACSVYLFALHRNFGTVPVILNLVPFACLLVVAYTLQRRKAILYYLVVIDGLLLIKALCGIAGIYFARHPVI